MPTENRIDPRKGFVPRYLPCLLALVAFCVYCLTLNRWVSLYNLAVVEKISGWDWRPQVMGPLTFLVTLPFHWLPASIIPMALDLFFRRLRGVDARPAGALGCVIAAGPDRCATQT